jgi:hypothetical protein
MEEMSPEVLKNMYKRTTYRLMEKCQMLGSVPDNNEVQKLVFLPSLPPLSLSLALCCPK